MKNITKYFSAEAVAELHKQLNVVLSDEYDYSEDELGELYAMVTEEFPYEFTSEGEPLYLGRIFEQIIDAFVKMGVV